MRNPRTYAEAQAYLDRAGCPEPTRGHLRDPDILRFAILLVLANPAQRQALIDGLNEACDRAGISGVGHHGSN